MSDEIPCQGKLISAAFINARKSKCPGHSSWEERQQSPHHTSGHSAQLLAISGVTAGLSLAQPKLPDDG